VKTTNYFQTIRTRKDRAVIKDEWIQLFIDHPEQEYIQQMAEFADGLRLKKRRVNICG